MSFEKMNACADMILTDAICDMAEEENISIEESRNRLLSSNACKCLYDFDSELWKEGPDYFLDYYRRSEKNLRWKQTWKR